MGTSKVSNPEMSNFHKVKENKGLCGDVPWYVAQATVPFDAEIVEKGHLWMETSL
ncbi:MAG: hypothetical protein JRF28_01815 [Deltaproteobacteria bacterium]|nr:hypothetical protein [Deltaproteobacteria bacterium]